ncbi:unnamed protein product [Calypogeia fissa]
MDSGMNRAGKNAAGRNKRIMIISNWMNTLLLGAVLFLLLVDSVASTSRSLQNLRGDDIDPRGQVESGLGSFTSHGRMTQRGLLQDGGYQSPGSGGGGPGTGDT